MQGEFEEAEKLMKEALRIDAKVLGKEHLDYAMDLNNYADILSDQVRNALELRKSWRLNGTVP